MNPHDFPDTIGPCDAQDEFELMELADGALPPERERAVRAHLAQCARCRRRHAAFAAVDASLAGTLPRPSLSAGFDRALRERIDALPRAGRTRAEARAAAERDHDRQLAGLRAGLGWRVALDALIPATVLGSLAFAFETVAPTLIASLGIGGADTNLTRHLLLALGAGVAGCAIAFARRPNEWLGLLAR
jgi:anti-sigma factor RsiW